LISLANLGLAYQAMGKLDLAILRLEEAFQLTKAKLGPDNRETLDRMHFLANALCTAGQFDQGLPLLEEVLKLRKARYGPDHPNTMKDLATAYRKAGKLAQLQVLYREQIAADTGDFTAKFELGRLLLDIAKTNSANAGSSHSLAQEGEQLMREYQDNIRSRYSNDPLKLADRLKDVPEFYYRQGNYAKAEALYREMIELRRSRLRPDHKDVMDSTASLARLLTDWAWAEHDSKSAIQNPTSEMAEHARNAEQLLREVIAVRLGDRTNSWRIGDVKVGSGERSCRSRLRTGAWTRQLEKPNSWKRKRCCWRDTSNCEPAPMMKNTFAMHSSASNAFTTLGTNPTNESNGSKSVCFMMPGNSHNPPCGYCSRTNSRKRSLPPEPLLPFGKNKYPAIG
jgi:tetratricopeptide (TPR) repeat protein